MKAPFSNYLENIAPSVKKFISLLREKYEYVSVLATDSNGLNVRISQHAKAVSSKTMTTERGLVVRVAVNGHYSEYALNDFDCSKVEETANYVISIFEAQEKVLQANSPKVYQTGILEDEAATLFVEKETEVLPEKADVKSIVEKLTDISNKAMTYSEHMIDCQAVGQSTHVCKMFLSSNRDLRQSYVYTEAVVMPIVSDAGRTESGYFGVSDLAGFEILDQLYMGIEEAVKSTLDAVHADRIVPGEYDIITSPEVSGLIAHEAFGHGVEMDQFVKGRALGAHYINQRIGSDQVTMHEGALCAKNVTSYAFDDEGVLAQDVTEIDHGILKTGICDALSALRLNTKATGNGKRENFEHKVYTRMTNTIFDSGDSTLEEMIASIKYGYLLEGMQSGMEDPKHWGIQCIISLGREIKDGKLTGKVVAPVLMTGYVPDLLESVSMASRDRFVYGNGGCGKGHKEWVKVSDGGPYLKMKGILG